LTLAFRGLFDGADVRDMLEEKLDVSIDEVNVLGYMTGRPSPKMDLVEGIKAMKKGEKGGHLFSGKSADTGRQRPNYIAAGSPSTDN
jgi:hypothetical protein